MPNNFQAKAREVEKRREMARKALDTASTFVLIAVTATTTDRIYTRVIAAGSKDDYPGLTCTLADVLSRMLDADHRAWVEDEYGGF